MRPHAPKPLPQANANKRRRGAAPALTWPVCSRCGLVYLTNEASRRAIAQACPGTDDD